jgi:2'-5' RNA ligase
VIELQKLIDQETLEFGDLKLGGHITLGRIKFLKDSKKFLEMITKIEIKPIEFNVNEFCLFKSTLSKDGSKYYILDKYVL